MQVSHILGRFLGLLLAIPAVPTLTRSQERAAFSPTSTAESSSYPDTTVGLQQLLQAMIQAAKADDSQKLTELLKDTEIPNCDAWLHSMYESDKADSWMGLCDPKLLGPNEKSLMENLFSLTKEDGQILTRKVNDDPEPGNGMESGWLQAIRQPLDIYFVRWTTPKNPKGEPIGYFMFIDGGFRWESGVQFVKLKIGTAKVIPAQLVKKVDPIYPAQAAANHIGGTVRVYFVIGADGVVYNAHAISGDGLSDDQYLRKAAEDAVIQWRYKPALVDGKPAESNAMIVNINFSPGN